MPVAPSFDVVRVEPNGDAVIAGRAPPGWEVIVRDGDEIVGRVTANSRGEWVLLPDKRFQPGSRELRLSARAPDGSVVESDRIVALAVPERRARSDPAAAPPPPPLAVELPKSGTGQAKILQGPRPPPEDAPVLAIDIIEFDGEGNMVIAGRAGPGSTVRVYLGERYLGEGVAQSDGAWRLVPEYRIRPGSFTLWAVELDNAGSAIARVEVSFNHGGPVANWPEGREIIIVHGHTLWWIARRLYGRGERYAVIFEANRATIRDPDLIYPGQKFSLPQVD